MDIYDTDTLEIDLWHYLHLFYRNKYFIIAIVVFCIIFSYFVSSYIIQKEYRSEMWIQLNSNFLYNEENISLDYIQIYLNYPEVLSTAMVGEVYNLNNFKQNLNLQKVNNLVQITFRYYDKNKIDYILNKWISAMQLKLIIDVGTTRFSLLQDEKVALQVNLDMMESKYKNIKDLLKQEGQYTEIEVISKDGVNPIPFVYKGLNPSYTVLNEQANHLKIEISELIDRQLLLEQIVKDYELVLDKVRQALLSGSFEFNEIVTRLDILQKNYSAYFTAIDDSFNCSLTPFRTISSANTKKDSVYPNVLFNTMSAGFMGFCIVIFFIILFDYIKSKEQVYLEKTNVKSNEIGILVENME